MMSVLMSRKSNQTHDSLLAKTHTVQITVPIGYSNLGYSGRAAYYSIHLKKSGIAYVLNPFELNATQFAKDARVWSCRFAEYVAKMTQN